MTIDEAITRAREVAEIHRNNDKLNKTLGKSSPYYNTDCIKCAEEHDQIAEWLEELKFLKQWKSDIMDSFCKYDVSSFEELIANAKNKAIDDFATKICEILEEYQTGFNMVSMANIWHFSREFAEQLTEGILND